MAALLRWCHIAVRKPSEVIITVGWFVFSENYTKHCMIWSLLQENRCLFSYFKILKPLVFPIQKATTLCLWIWRMTLKALSSRVQYKYKNQSHWMDIGLLWSPFNHLILSSAHATAGADSAMIVLGRETARVKTRKGIIIAMVSFLEVDNHLIHPFLC